MTNADDMLNAAINRRTSNEEPKRAQKDRNSQPQPKGQASGQPARTANEQKPKRQGLTSFMDKAGAYASRFSSQASKAARKVQARSTRLDAQKAADKAERAAGLVSSTLVGLVKTAVAGTVGTTKGLLTGSAQATKPAFVTALHANDDLAPIGTWAGEIDRYEDRKGIPYDEARVSIEHEAAHELLGNKNALQLDDAAVTNMAIEGRQTQVIAVPLFEEGTSSAMGCVVLEYDDNAENRVFLNLWDQ